MPAPTRTSRDAIVQAARALLEQQGLDAVVMNAVAERVGAILYNLVHDLATGVAVAGVGLAIGSVPLAAAGAILVAHSGMDRIAGYGLKYPDAFRHTHLGWIGRDR